ncbi:hypothetical protein DL96DRAFT_1474827 [Flagelloscypha sp. PMI_526]|nr:hypothetical protein DL96DRAFT_1474827 [Flagelloscypha sp. PMI_526]
MNSVEYGTSLPPLSTVTFDERGLKLWPFLLSAEKAASCSTSTQGNLVGSRVLGYFLIDFWDHRKLSLGHTPYVRLCDEIASCIGMTSAPIEPDEETRILHDNLWQLGLMYRNYVMRLFRHESSRSQSPWSDNPPRSFEQHRENILMAIRQGSRSKSDSRGIALIRDGYKCMLCGCIDGTSLNRYAEVQDIPGFSCDTQVAYLFLGLAQHQDEVSLDTLNSCVIDMEVNTILGGDANDPQNILTMEHSLYNMFDRFWYWLEEVVDMPNTYDVVVSPASADVFNRSGTRPPSRVTFMVDERCLVECKQQNILPPALPHPKLIALRASCARVAHLSGAAEQIDNMYRELEETDVLSEDGN